MYSTCLFCHSALGKNDTIEQFPVGRRLAYDASKGRLWVVCTKCARWNLSPIEERWEAIEAAERFYRETRKRVATDNIGLARLRDGTDLIRIGAPLRPEFAAWRYGANFSKRHKKGLLYGAAALAAGAGIVGGTISVSSGSMVLAALTSVNYLNSARTMWQLLGRRINRVTVTANDGVRIKIARADLHSVSLIANSQEADPTWSAPRVSFIRKGKEREHGVRFGRNPDGSLANGSHEAELIQGPEALVAIGLMLAAMNRLSGAPRHVASAVSLLENAGSLPAVLRAVSPQVKNPWWSASNVSYERVLPLGVIPTPARLALEMSLHEEDERRAMEGDLLELERRWKEAEEIAGIADSLTLSPSAEGALANYKAKSRPAAPDSPSRSD